MANLKIDLEQDEVFVFTPKGRVITLPVGRHADRLRLLDPHRGRPRVHRRRGSTAGSCRSTTSSQSGDTVEIFTSKVEGAGPSRDWLKFVATPRAAQQDPPVVLAGAARGRHRDRPRGAGQGAAPRGPAGAEDPEHRRARRSRPTTLNYADLDAPLRRHRRATTCRAKSVAQRVAPDPARGRGGDRGAPADHRPHAAAAQAHASDAGVHVEGLDDVMVRLSRCCTPVPGDEIMGFVTRGRGVSVHRADCANAVSLATRPGRPAHRRRVGRRGRHGMFVAVDRGEGARPLAAAARRVDALSDHHVNILACSTAHRHRPHLEDALRLRAGDPQPPRLGARARSSRSTASTTPTASCPARVARSEMSPDSDGPVEDHRYTT